MKKTIDINDEALPIYNKWKSHERSQKVSQLIIDSEKEPFTEAQKKWIMDRITEAVHACYRS